MHNCKVTVIEVKENPNKEIVKSVVAGEQAKNKEASSNNVNIHVLK